MGKPRVRALVHSVHSMGLTRSTSRGLQLSEQGKNRLRKLWDAHLKLKVGDLSRIGLDRFPLSERQPIVGRIKSERRGPMDVVRAMSQLLAYDRHVYTYQISALRRKKKMVESILRKRRRIAGTDHLPVLKSEVRKIVRMIEDRQNDIAGRIQKLQLVEEKLNREIRTLDQIPKDKRTALELEAERIIDEFQNNPIIDARIHAYRKANQRFIRERHRPRDST